MTNRAACTVMVAMAAMIGASCGSATGGSRAEPSISISVSSTLADPPPLTAEHVPETLPLPPAEVALSETAITALGAGPRVRMILPTREPPYFASAQAGAFRLADGSWGWGYSWLWSQQTPHTLPDGSQAGSDWGVSANSSEPNRTSTPLTNGTELLWKSGTISLVLLANEACPVPGSDEAFTPEMSIEISDAGTVLLNIGLLPAPICGIAGENMTPAELVTLLSGLADCEVGGGSPIVCTPLAPPSPDEAVKAAAMIGTPKAPAG